MCAWGDTIEMELTTEGSFRHPSERITAVKLIELADRLGVKIVPGYQDKYMRHHPAMMRRKHNEENGFAWLVNPTTVAYDRALGTNLPENIRAAVKEWPSALDNIVEDIFHEMMHAVCGPECLKDEGSLMPVQWELMKLLDDQEYVQCRENFAHYSMEGGDVGRDDNFIHGRAWLQLSYEAKAQSLLTMKGEPNWPYLCDSSKWGRAFGVSGKGQP